IIGSERLDAPGVSAANAALLETASAKMATKDFSCMVLSLSRIRIVLLASALTAVAPCAFPAPPKSHDEALSALSNPETTTRLEAIVWLANYGTMSDAPRLHERLRDESAIVRAYAEQGL